MATCKRTVTTWDQLVLGGGAVRFHLETQGNFQALWECDTPSDCDDCHDYERNRQHGDAS